MKLVKQFLLLKVIQVSLIWLVSIEIFANNVAISAHQVQFKIPSAQQLAANIALELGNNSNVTHQFNDEESSPFLKINPSVIFHNNFDKSQLILSYQGDFDFITQNHDFNTSSHLAAAKYSYQFVERSRLFLTGAHSVSDEAIGTGISRGKQQTIETPDQKQLTLLNVGLQLGNDTSISKWVSLVGIKQFEYKTRPEFTEYFTSKSNFIVSEFDYLYSGITYMTAKIEMDSTKYEFNENKNSTTYAALIGASWRGTDNIAAQLLVGLQKIELDSGQKDSGSSWQASLDWHPKEHWQVLLNAARRYESSNYVDQLYRESDQIKLGLNYLFSNQTRLNMTANIQSDSLVSQTFINDETISQANVEYIYPWSEKLLLSLKLQQEKVDSDLEFVTHTDSNISIKMDYRF